MYKMNPLPPQISRPLLDRLATLETATIGHTHLFGFASPEIQPVVPGNVAVGTAVTLALPGADSTLLHDIVGRLRPGDFLVIDRLGDTRHACFGGGVANAAKTCGFAGVAVDGPHTDTAEIVDHGFPTWSRGASSITTRLYDIGGGFNIPVSCGGAAVLPGYAVLADDSGVLFVAPEDLAEVIAVAEAKTKRGEDVQARVTSGEKLGALSGASAKVAAKCGSDH